MSTLLNTPSHDAKPVETQVSATSPMPLTELNVGDHGRLHETRLVVEEREMLRALGLAERSRFRVCKAGDPWILQVRSTRVGMSDAVANHILVTRDRQR